MNKPKIPKLVIGLLMLSLCTTDYMVQAQDESLAGSFLSGLLDTITSTADSKDCPGVCVHTLATLICYEVLEDIPCPSASMKCCIESAPLKNVTAHHTTSSTSSTTTTTTTTSTKKPTTTTTKAKPSTTTTHKPKTTQKKPSTTTTKVTTKKPVTTTSTTAAAAIAASKKTDKLKDNDDKISKFSYFNSLKASMFLIIRFN